MGRRGRPEKFTIVNKNRLEPDRCVIQPIARVLADFIRSRVRSGDLIIKDGHVRLPNQSAEDRGC
jgi:hypothetical protein